MRAWRCHSRWLWAVVTTLGVVAAAGCGDDDGHPPQPFCGDGNLDPGEVCDGSELSGATCEQFGWFMGEVTCSASCLYDVSGCVGGGPDCGNWEIEWGEDCDTNELGGANCEGLGMSPGTLACNPDCTFDRSGCGAAASCGNGLIDGQSGVEECDGGDLADQSCESLGYMGGLLACATNCIFDESDCWDPECGNGVREGDEWCDGTDFGQEDCVTWGHTGGELLCTENCIVDDSQCTD